MIETHTGPMPQFPKSPASEATPGPSSRARQKAKQVARQPDGTHPRAPNPAVEPVNNFRPTAGAQLQQTHTYGGVTAGSSIQGQALPPRLTDTANNTNGTGDALLRQQPANPGSSPAGDFFGLNPSSTGLASGDFDFSSFDFPDDEFTSGGAEEAGASNADFAAFLGGQQARESSKQAHGAANVNQSHGGAPAQKGNAGTGVTNPLDFGHSTTSAPGTGPGSNIGDGSGQVPDVPELPDFLANKPIQSVEREQPATAAAHLPQSGTVHDAGPDTPAQAAPGARFPPGYTTAGAVFRDAHGVWYYDPHGGCHVALGHRHDWDGGVHFGGEESVTQSFALMHKREGVGFLLGLAAGQALCGGGGGGGGAAPSPDSLRAAAEVARGALPEERQASVTVPDPAVVQRLMGVNGQLPGSYYYEPFTNRVVQYDLPAGLASQNGKQGNVTGSRSNQGAGASGGPTQ